METILTDSLVRQAPIVFVLIIGFVALWRQNNQQQAYLRDLLDQCWKRLFDHLQDDSRD